MERRWQHPAITVAHAVRRSYVHRRGFLDGRRNSQLADRRARRRRYPAAPSGYDRVAVSRERDRWRNELLRRWGGRAARTLRPDMNLLMSVAIVHLH